MTVNNIGASKPAVVDIPTNKVALSQTKSITNENSHQTQGGYAEKIENKVDLEDAVDHMNELLKPIRRNLKFEMHEKLERYYVTVVDSETSEVIKEIPPKKMLDMYAELAEFMGFLIDEKI
ncbi:flagellar protein FlaG [Oceanobacillus iheyensis]|uniref:flagellar protein FlaG n=1 Tax=Oceanobacillus iheyensis TaxID=182710 RepID=UPI003631CFAA